MNNLVRLLPDNDVKRKWLSIGSTVAVTAILTLWGIYVIGDYGLAMFVLTPFLVGALPTLLYGSKKVVTKRQAFQFGMLALGILLLGLLAFAIEGVICIAMALPGAVLFTWLGGLTGRAIVNKKTDKSLVSIVLLLSCVPFTAFLEKDVRPDLIPVTTAIEIKAQPKTVWKNVVAFPQLNEPEEFIFRAGVSYPINAKIDGVGVGAIRYCNFNSGRFVEPITVWNENKLLAFDVVDQPVPMKELSFWDIDAPHLHDYFVSRKGQFKLTALANGNTLLEGTTWYYHDIKPAIYWQFWSNYIVHKIHERVLIHIKRNAERETVH